MKHKYIYFIQIYTQVNTWYEEKSFTVPFGGNQVLLAFLCVKLLNAQF